jgi:hypothetical protein
VISKDLLTILNADSILIESGGKAGKMTFLFYLINFLYKEKAIIFTPQESYLFKRRIKSLSGQYQQFANLDKIITAYYLDENWNSLKQKYGYEFFLQELTQIITTSEEKIIVLHRIGEFFEFQDRYEIENVYKTLIKLATVHGKKMIFLANDQNENYEYIRRIADEFTDVSIGIKNNENNERLINIKDVLQNKEYPIMHFKIHNENFILDLYEKDKGVVNSKTKNILIAELNQSHDNMKDICNYIFQKPNFSVKYADSLQSILQEIFIAPDVIIVLMKREQANFDTISAIKKQLPDTMIIAIVDQKFVRTEDIQEAYTNGCDELFANNLSLETLILSLQKASKTLFYTESMKTIPQFNNILDSLEDFETLANDCISKSLFFTAFTIETKDKFEFVSKSSRNSDYLYQTEHKIYYLALSTMPKDIRHIVDKYKSKHSDLALTCMWEPINHDTFENCIHG